jgi:hypothetical protein
LFKPSLAGLVLVLLRLCALLLVTVTFIYALCGPWAVDGAACGIMRRGMAGLGMAWL